MVWLSLPTWSSSRPRRSRRAATAMSVRWWLPASDCLRCQRGLSQLQAARGIVGVPAEYLQRRSVAAERIVDCTACRRSTHRPLRPHPRSRDGYGHVPRGMRRCHSQDDGCQMEGGGPARRRDREAVERLRPPPPAATADRVRIDDGLLCHRHVKLGLKLADTGYKFRSDARAQIYLTNALEPAQDLDMQLAFVSEALAHEAQAANTAKGTRFTVVMGNPPYSSTSANMGPTQRLIIEPYRFIKGEKIQGCSTLWNSGD